MEKIKFKGWDKLNKKWIDIWKIAFQENQAMAVEDLEGEMYGLHQIELVPYTGVNDQDKNEIYCGDIREYHDVEKGMGIVKFHEGRYLLFPITNSKGDMNPWALGNVWTKKVGTIYENPELLKEKNL